MSWSFNLAADGTLLSSWIFGCTVFALTTMRPLLDKGFFEKGTFELRCIVKSSLDLHCEK